MKTLIVILLIIFASLAFGAPQDQVLNSETGVLPGVGKITREAVATESVDTVNLDVYVSCFQNRNGKMVETPRKYIGTIPSVCAPGPVYYSKDAQDMVVGFDLLVVKSGPSHCPTLEEKLACEKSQKDQTNRCQKFWPTSIRLHCAQANQ